MRKLTWFGIIVCILAVLPGTAVGGIVALIFKAITAYQYGQTTPFWILTVFGVDAPSRFITWVLVYAFGAAAHGGIAGAIAVAITRLIYIGPKIGTVSFTTGALYGGFFFFILIVHGLMHGVDAIAAEAVCQIVGLWIGLGLVALKAPKRETVRA